MFTLTLSNPLYPKSLTQTAPPVTQVYTEGDSSLLSHSFSRVALVGSRKMTPYGKEVTNYLARGLASRGVVIVSGLAYGVDAQAHMATLEVGGKAIAVLPSSIDTIYPSHHQSLAKKIVTSGGLLLSEYPHGTTAAAWRFIARNRIIASLSQTVVVVEASSKSGSLHTAQFALEQGIEVCAVPGSIFSSLSQGCHQLISNGATPVTDIDDILSGIGAIITPTSSHFPGTDSPAQKAILAQLANGSASTDEISSRAHLDIATLQHHLTLLEINQSIVSIGNSLWAIRR